MTPSPIAFARQGQIVRQFVERSHGGNRFQERDSGEGELTAGGIDEENDPKNHAAH